MNSRLRLPIDGHLQEIERLWSTHANLVLQSPPGSGKTTRVPPALLASSALPQGAQIWVLLPRRLAAKMAAARVAEELGEALGHRVGYQFRFEKAVSTQTRLLFLTEGMLVRKLLGSPRLPAVHTVILDEFHERHLQSDFALAYLRHLQRSTRPDLKICLMSATFKAEPLAAYLGGAPVFTAQTPQFEVEQHYLNDSGPLALETLVVQNLQRHPLESGEDTLVFLPGFSEIKRTEAALHQARLYPMEILPLHGSLPPTDQQKIFEKFSRPKVVLATNIAESSLTIPGLKRVLDSGWHRQSRYSWWSGIPRLETRPISQAAAVQRAGRAGRTGPGRCFRLYTSWEFQSRPQESSPEITRADLAQMYLELLALGVSDLQDFPWLLAPEETVATHCLELLQRLGAVRQAHAQWEITELGRQLCSLPVHPRVGRLLWEGRERGVREAALTLAAGLSEGDLPEGALESIPHSRGFRRITEKLREQLGRALALNPAATLSSQPEQDLGLSVLRAFPDRVAKRSDRTWNFCLGGSGVVPKNLWDRVEDLYQRQELAVVLDVGESVRPGERSQVHLRSWLPMDPAWLYEDVSGLLQEKSELLWTEPEGRLVERHQITYGELVLEGSRGRPSDLHVAAEVFLRQALKFSDTAPFLKVHDLLTALGRLTDPSPLERALGKWKWVAQLKLDPSVPPPEVCLEKSFLQHLFHGLLHKEELKAWPFENRVLAYLPAGVQAKWQRWLPDTVTLPTRPRVQVHYDWDHEPYLASRLQDFFGLKMGPCLAEGRLPLTLKLLAPNNRPVQVTKDLNNFWRQTYPELRKALSRRYPRHRWPLDPLGEIPKP